MGSPPRPTRSVSPSAASSATPAWNGSHVADRPVNVPSIARSAVPAPDSVTPPPPVAAWIAASTSAALSLLIGSPSSGVRHGVSAVAGAGSPCAPHAARHRRYARRTPAAHVGHLTCP
ncbi:MAG TPA: hypothetical protein VHV74_11720 [Pseudonocardiaceae bacterium]|nr:hypothetical protein [Pseudonocardiaceae bacterium]